MSEHRTDLCDAQRAAIIPILERAKTDALSSGRLSPRDRGAVGERLYLTKARSL